MSSSNGADEIVDPPTGGRKGKKKSKSKTTTGSTCSDHNCHVDHSASSSVGPPSNMSAEQHLRNTLEMLSLSGAQQQPTTTAAKDLTEARNKKYAFWETQPVPKFDETEATENEAIEPNRDAQDIRQEGYSLPQGFNWVDVDMNNKEELQELYVLLNENYVEDDDHMFRFDYGAAFLQWALMPPGWLPQWHCGVRANTTGKLLAFIAAVPCTIRVHDKVRPMVEINFLCVHKKLRSKRVAPVLIREITRRVNMQGIFQAVYTAGVVIPRPVTTCRYWHRPLNPKKLIDVGFSYLSRNMTMARTLKLYKLPDAYTTPNLRLMRQDDVGSAFRLLDEYLKQFALAPMFSLDEFTHFFLPRDGVVDTYISEKDGSVTDLISFYHLPSTVVNHAKHKTVRAVYAFYNVATSVDLTTLMHDALVAARLTEHDVFNALDLMHNEEYLKKLKFGIGDGNLQYYLYNWRCPALEPRQIALVLQ